MNGILPCPFCGRPPKHGKTKTRYCQLHGEPFQNYRVWCEQHASIEATNKKLAIAEWNTRAPARAEEMPGA